MKIDITGQGHRKRVQEKILKAEDLSFLSDYELLEAILMRSIPRIDVKPIGKRLLNDFGSLSAVLNAPKEVLMTYKNIKESTIALFKIMSETNRRILCDSLQEKPVLQSWQQVMDYCSARLKEEKIEQFLVLYLDSGLRLVHQEIQQKGTTDRVALYPREILKQALIIGARAVVIAHNHPSGQVQPSPADLTMTVELYKMLQVSHIQLLDHLIVGSDRRIYSFSAQGHLENAPSKIIK